MKRQKAVPLFFFATFLLIAGCASTQQTETKPQTPEQKQPAVWGYHTYWTGDLWKSYDFDRLDGLFFFELEASRDGTLNAQHGWPDRWQALRQRAQEAGVLFVPVITLFGRENFVKLFGNPRQRALFLRNVVATVTTAQADGLQLDVEVSQAVPDSARDGFTAFISKLRPLLLQDNPSATLSLFAPAFDRADVFDESALAGHINYFVVQGYDLHYRGSPATGPVAPLRGWSGQNWKAIAQRYRNLGVPASKVIMSAPFFGYEWQAESAKPGAATTSRGRTISYAEVEEKHLAAVRTSARERVVEYGGRRDSASGSPYYAFRDSTGQWRQGWFEDEQSLSEKWRFLEERGLRGLAVFPLGYDGGELLETLPIGGARP